ncbi:hypothetical protein B0H17DRAFT_1067968 [Mycena rosella]|uniref:Uncharacterized protein n=1 Tax=Mycena rosella TaxID=1033263 RepID=A0AAD7DCZ3_MYCRO|nr:hypothetical protein B0H17DRAFT_1067968 [Mycena rosella]
MDSVWRAGSNGVAQVFKRRLVVWSLTLASRAFATGHNMPTPQSFQLGRIGPSLARSHGIDLQMPHIPSLPETFSEIAVGVCLYGREAVNSVIKVELRWNLAL